MRLSLAMEFFTMLEEKKYITLKDKTRIYTETYERGAPVWIVAVHGVGEHLGRHTYLRELFCEDFNIFQFDLRGHGESGGRRGFINDFSDYTNDLAEILDYLKKNYELDRLILFGHSMGALIVMDYLKENLHKKNVMRPERVFLSAPPLVGGGHLGVFFKYLPFKTTSFLANIPKSVPLKGLVNLKNLSHDPRVHESYVSDKKNVLSLHSKLVFHLAKKSQEIFGHPLKLDIPIYCTLGSDDKIINVKDVEFYFTHLLKNSILYILDGGYHELHNEIWKYKQKYFAFLRQSMMETLTHL